MPHRAPHAVFLDECGYTGDDLLDADQPVFVIATHAFEEDEAARIRQEFFGTVRAPELKHTSLQRRKPHQEGVIALLGWLHTQPGSVRAGIAHKRFALTAKLVDFLIEPVMHRDGLNLYADGGHGALSNMLYTVFSVDGTLGRLLPRFQRLVRTASASSWRDWTNTVAARSSIPIVDETLDILRATTARLHRGDISGLPARSLDLSLSLGLNCVYAWRRQGYDRMRVVHDASTNMARQKLLWDGILSPSAPPATVGYGNYGVTFPIGVAETVFTNSAESASLQLSDVIAGALCRFGKWHAAGMSASDSYGKRLAEVFAPMPPEVLVSAIWPTRDVVPKPTAPGLADPLEYLTDRVRELSRRG